MTAFWGKKMNGLGFAAVLIGYLTTIGGAAAVFWRVWKKLRAIADAQQCVLRTRITELYYFHSDDSPPTLREYQRQNLDELFDGYKALGGNHYVDDLYRKMRDSRVVS